MQVRACNSLPLLGSFILYVVALLLSATLILPVGAQNLIRNGGFETPRVPNQSGYLTFSTGANVGGWIVTGQSVDVHGGGHTAPHSGDQSLDLSGYNLPGGVYQNIATVPGQDYIISFWVAGHPYHTDPKPDKRFELRFGNASTGILTIARASSTTNMNWTHFQFRFTAEAASTRVWFISYTLNGGAIIDDVSVTVPPLFANPQVNTDASVTLPIYAHGVANSNVTMLLVIDGRDDASTLQEQNIGNAANWVRVGQFILASNKAIGAHTLQVKMFIQPQGQEFPLVTSSAVMLASILDFSAVGDGWAFGNSFPDRPIAETLLSGLCGGMSKQVSDYFNQGQALPAHSATGPSNRLFYSLLGTHIAVALGIQLDSVRVATQASLLGSTAAAIKGEITNILFRLRSEQKTSVMILKGSLLPKGGAAHAVAPHAGFNCVDFFDASDNTAKKNLQQAAFYDPNYPGNSAPHTPLYVYLFDTRSGDTLTPGMKWDRNAYSYPIVFQYTQ